MATDSNRNNVVLFGGRGKAGAFDDTWIWNGSRWSRATPKVVPLKRSAHALCYNPVTRRVTMFGGYLTYPFALAWPDVFEWDGTDWARIQPTTRPPASANNLFVYEPTAKKLLLTAGRSLRELWTWDGKVWAKLNPQTKMPTSHCWTGVTDTGRGQIIVSGAKDATQPDEGLQTWTWSGNDWKLLHTFKSYPLWNTGNPLLAMDQARDELLMLGLVDRYPGTPRYDSQMWSLRGDDWVQLKPKTMPPARRGGTGLMFYEANAQRVVLLGGLDVNFKSLHDIWVWDGTNWVEHKHSRQSGAPTSGRLAYHSARARVVRYPFDGKQWTWGYGTGWSLQSQPTSPPRQPCISGAWAYDHARRVLVHHVVASCNHTHGEVWEWDGRWRKSAGKAPPRLGSAGFFSPLGSLIFLPSGRRNSAGSYDELCWQYDGSKWQSLALDPLPIVGPSATTRPMIFDLNRRILRSPVYGGGFDLSWARLRASRPYPRLGDVTTLTATVPAQANQSLIWAFSTKDWACVPVGSDRYGRTCLPLGSSPLLTATLAAGLVTPLDQHGRSSLRLQVPTSPGLLGLRVFAAGAVSTARGVADITNVQEIEVVR